MKAWNMRPLVEVCEFTAGLWTGKTPPFLNIPVIRNTNFTKDGTLDLSNVANIEVEPRKLEKRRLKCGDILLEKSGGGPKQAVGRVVLFEEKSGEYSFSNFTSALRVRDPSEVDPKFLHRFLHWTYVSGVTEGMQSHSTGIRNLDGDAYKAIAVPLPPLPEQKRIVDILDEAFAAIATAKANTEKNFQNARALFDNHLEAIFAKRGAGWKDKPLGEVALTVSTGPFGTMLHKSDYVEQGIPLVNPVNIVNSKVVPSSRMMVSEETAQRLSGYQLRAGDVVVARRGELGRCALITENEVGWLCGTGSFFVRLSAAMDGEFLVALLGSTSIRSRLEASSVGTTMSSLNHGILKSLVLPVPSVEEQNRIMCNAHLVRSATEDLAAMYLRKVDTLEALKKSLLYTAFSGEL